MTETIYESRQKTEKAKRQLPNNRRQIGQPGQAEPEVFLEDYAFAFARGLAGRDYTGYVVGILVGEYCSEEERETIFVRGVLEASDVLARDVICFTEENWTEIYRDIREYFPGEQIVGWYLGGPGFLLEDEERQKKIQADNFGGGDKILFKVDSIEKKETILFYRDGELQELPGYYIYYEKNEEMQNYIAKTHRTILLEEEDAGKEQMEESDGWNSRRDYSVGRTVVGGVPQEKEEVPGLHSRVREPKSSSFYQLFYATGGVLACLAILVIAGLAMQIQERDQLKQLLNEKRVSSMQQVYVVEEGETIASICIKFYGTTEQEEAIRLLNSLESDEEPEEGRKIFLP